MIVDTGPLVLLYVPAFGAVTLTVTVQIAPAAIVPPENEIDPAPATGANVGAPHPLVVAFGVAATTIAPGATGNVSLKAMPPRELFWFGLVIVNVSVETPFGMIGDGENTFAIDGGMSAVNVAVARLDVFVPPSVVERGPLTFECGPAVVAVTLTLTVQEPLAGIVPPLNVSVVFPASGAQVAPAHVVAAAGVAATCTPAGRLSVNAAPVSVAVFVLVSVNVSVETALTAIGFGANAFAIVGWMGARQPVRRT